MAPRHDDDVASGAAGADPPPARLRGAAAARLHVTLVAGLALCVAAFVFEVGRALGGNTLSWAYVFEWPIFAVFALYMWWHLLHDVAPDGPGGATTDRGPGAAAQDVPPGAGPTAVDGDDPDLVAWRAYLAGMEAEERRQADGDGSD